MALRATIGADFSEFSTALKNVEVQLKTTADHAKNAGKDLTRMVEGFSGSKLFRDAELVAEAVGRIGGASKLTDAEQRKVNRTIEEAMAKYRALGQEAPAHLQKLAAETHQVGTATESWGASITKSAAGYLAGMATWDMAKRVIGGTVEFLKESVAAAAEAEAAQKRLETAMRTNGIATEGNRAAFKALADEMQRTTVYEDDQIVALEAMATQLGVLPSQMEGAIKAAANLASGLGIDLEQAMKMVVKANNESFTAFQKLGISIDETRAKAEGLPYVLEQINAGLGGQAAAEVETYAGQLKQLTNEWGNLKEALGEAIISNGLLGASLRTLTDLFRGVNVATKDWGNTLSVLAAMGLRGGLASVVDELLRIGKIPPPKLDPKGITDGAMAMRQALDGVNESLDKLLKKAKDQAAKDFDEAGRAAEKAAAKTQAWRDSVRDLTFVLTLGEKSLGHLNAVVTSSSGVWEHYRDTIKNLYSKDLPLMYAGLAGTKTETVHFTSAMITSALAAKTSMVSLGTVMSEVFDNINTKFGQAAQAAGAAWDIISGVTQRKNPETGEMEDYDVGGKMVAGLGAAKTVLDMFVTGADRAAVATRGLATGAVTGAAAVMGAYALMGSAAGPVGIAIGATVGAVVGLVAAWNAAGAAARDANRAADVQLQALREELVDTYGSLANLDIIGKQLGVDFAGAWGDTTVAGTPAFLHAGRCV